MVLWRPGWAPEVGITFWRHHAHTIVLLLMPSVDGKVLGIATVENRESSPRISLGWDLRMPPANRRKIWKTQDLPCLAEPPHFSKRHKQSPVTCLRPKLVHQGAFISIWSMEVTVPGGTMLPTSVPWRPGVLLVAERASALRFRSQRPGAGCAHGLPEAFHLIYSAGGVSVAMSSVCAISQAGHVPRGDRDEAARVKGCCPLAVGENRRAVVLLPELGASPWLSQRRSETE